MLFKMLSTLWSIELISRYLDIPDQPSTRGYFFGLRLNTRLGPCIGLQVFILLYFILMLFTRVGRAVRKIPYMYKRLGNDGLSPAKKKAACYQLPRAPIF